MGGGAQINFGDLTPYLTCESDTFLIVKVIYKPENYCIIPPFYSDIFNAIGGIIL
jgi:hypothetical protein